jgi:uncharacterized protein YkwD
MVRWKRRIGFNLLLIILVLILSFSSGGLTFAQQNLPGGSLFLKRKTGPPPSDMALRVIALVNKERAKKGCRPLVMKSKLNKAALEHSKDMAFHHLVSHTGTDGSQPADRMTRVGYGWLKAAENVAAGFTSPESVVNGWMKSPGHRANILDCSFQDTGVGYDYLAIEAESGDYGYYWTMVFGSPR